MFFEGLAWKGGAVDDLVVAGISSSKGPGEQLTNDADKSVFLRHPVGDGKVRFEALAHPGFFIAVEVTGCKESGEKFQGRTKLGRTPIKVAVLAF